MRSIIAAGLAWLCLVGAAAAEEKGWVTFKTAHNSWGRIDYQIDMQSVRPEGPYRTFWSRIWIAQKQQPMMITINEALFALSRKYAVDCAQRRFGGRFIDSNDPSDFKRRANLESMRWEALAPALERAACGKGS